MSGDDQSRCVPEPRPPPEALILGVFGDGTRYSSKHGDQSDVEARCRYLLAAKGERQHSCDPPEDSF